MKAVACLNVLLKVTRLMVSQHEGLTKNCSIVFFIRNSYLTEWATNHIRPRSSAPTQVCYDFLIINPIYVCSPK